MFSVICAMQEQLNVFELLFSLTLSCCSRVSRRHVLALTEQENNRHYLK